jgi:hypothetical protein
MNETEKDRIHEWLSSDQRLRVQIVEWLAKEHHDEVREAVTEVTEPSDAVRALKVAHDLLLDSASGHAKPAELKVFAAEIDDVLRRLVASTIYG